MRLALAALTIAAALLVPASALAWPNGPDEIPCADPPNDPGYDGSWNLWSFVPGPHLPEACDEGWMRNDWTDAEGFREEELALGSGIHADRAWQRTTGDRRVIVAVLDSGAYWDNRDLVNKYYLNRGELAGCKPTPMEEPPEGADDFDVDGSGWFDIRDYYAAAGSEAAVLDELDANGNGMVDPQDLIIDCSDGVDDDGNGYTDDISGWDFFGDDNDAYDDNRFGHGNGEARWSMAEGDNGIGDIGVCPDCTALMVRVADSFVGDANEFAHGAAFAVDSGASVVQEALGTVNHTEFSRAAIEYAYANDVTVIASAADELSFHHNMPGTNNHTVYVHATVYDGSSASSSTTFLNFNNCTNYGMNLVLSTPGHGCSSEATGITAGQTGLLYSKALEMELDPPLSAEEAKQLMTMNVDDIDVNPDGSDETKFPSGPGWDWHFGYGRNNARLMLDALVAEHIPPEVDIVEPLWFEVIFPDRTPSVEVTGRINMRMDGRPARYDSVDWTFEYAVGVDPTEEDFVQVDAGTTQGTDGVLVEWDVSQVPVDLDPRTDEAHQKAVTVRLRATGEAPDGTTVTGEMRKGFLFERDPDLVDGFPKYLGTSAESSPVFADLDGDGAQDLVLATSDGMVHAWKHDGGEVDGFPVKLRLRNSVHPDNALNVRGACAFREDKTGCVAQQGLTLDPDVSVTMMMPPAVGDLDGDEDLEIVITTWDGWVSVLEHDGTMRPGWPNSVDFDLAQPDRDNIVESGFFAAPVLADLDGEPGLEILAAAMDQHLYAWHEDGSVMSPYPVKVNCASFDLEEAPECVFFNQDPEESARIVSTPAVGDVDGDGDMEIAVGTSETFGASGNANEAVAYVLDAKTGAMAPGWPQSLFGLTVSVLPIVGEGVVGNPMMADLDYDGTLEISFDTISTQGWFFDHDGELWKKMDNQAFGPGSDSEDSPAYILMNNGAIANFDGKGGLDMLKGTAGFDFAVAFAGGGKRKPFDHHMSAWDTSSGEMVEGFPRVHDDWQFFNAPTVVDIDNDNSPEVLISSGGYLLRAWNYLGEQPEGWPKQTGGWVIASAAVGDWDGDQLFEVALPSRDGWLYVWDTEGKAGQSIYEWAGFGGNPHNTNNYQDDPTPYKTWSGEVQPPPVDEDPEPGVEPVPDAGPTEDARDDTVREDTVGPTPDAAPDVAVDAGEQLPDEDDDEGGGGGGGCAGGAPGSGGLAALAGLALLLVRRRVV
ncbi:MAG: S8 family serine peptidase [Myxococcota bacterium]